MATSGSMTTSSWSSSSGQTRNYTLSWTAKQDVATNKSTITWTLSATGTYPYNVAERTLNVVIAGETVYSKTDRVMRGKGTVATGTKVITHGTDGKKSFSASIQAAVYYSTVNCTASKTFELTQIPRQATISSAPNFNDEENPTITYSNPAGSAVTSLQACISFDGSSANVPYRDISKTGTSYTFSLTDAERTILRNGTTTANSRTVYFYVKTVISGTTFYSRLAKTLSIVNATPTLSPTIVDTNSTTIALTGDNNKLIRYYSNAAVTFGAAALKGATIKSKKVTNGSNSLTADGTINAVTSGSFAFTATDTRGNTVNKTVTPTFVEYIKLTCSLDTPAPNIAGDMTFTIKGNYFSGSFGSQSNNLNVEYRYKINDGSYTDWIAAPISLSGHTYSCTVDMSGLDYRSTYTFQARATDELMSIPTSEQSVRTPPVFDWGKEDFNFNVPVMINGQTVLRHNSEANNTVLSASGGHIYIRPQGTDNTTGEIRITPQGDIILGGQSLKALLGIS